MANIIKGSELLQIQFTLLFRGGMAFDAIFLHQWHNPQRELVRQLSQRGFECVYLDAPFLLPMTSIVMVEGVPGKLGCGLAPLMNSPFL